MSAPMVECEACGEECSEAELTELEVEEMTHEHPGMILLVCPVCADDGP